MLGYGGKLLFMDLSTKRYHTEPTEKYIEFIGGRGINQWILFNTIDRDTHPLDKENIIILGAGALCGTAAPAASRLSVDFKNVITGGVGSGNAGGHFAAELKYAGYDSVIIQGSSDKPIYILITNNGIYFKDASTLWGKSVWEADNMIKDMEGDPGIHTAIIGRGGENLVKFSCIIVDKGRAPGYGGSGAVFGSKKLKAVAVRGKVPIYVHDPKLFMQKVKHINSMFEKSRVVKIHREGGTLHAYTITGELRGHGVRNMSSEFWSNEDISHITREKFDTSFMTRRHSCFGCPVYCSAIYNVNGNYCEGVQANMVRAFATNMDIKDSEAVLKANIKVNNYGLDCDHTSAVISWAIECYENGIIDKHDTGGIELRWGKHKSVLKLIDMIANKEGLGEILANGVYEASKIIGRGSERFALIVKKNNLMEAAMRSHKAWSLGIVTSTKGGGHTRGAPGLESCEIPPEVSKKILGIGDISDPTRYENKAELVVWQEKYKAVIDSMGICSLPSMWQDIELFQPDNIAEIYYALSGRYVSGNELMQTGLKIQNIERAFNLLHAGFDRKNDYPPPKLINIPVDKGIYTGQRLELENWEKMLDSYYKIHNWDIETGRPTEKILRKLGLTEVLKKLKDNGIYLEGEKTE